MNAMVAAATDEYAKDAEKYEKHMDGIKERRRASKWKANPPASAPKASTWAKSSWNRHRFVLSREKRKAFFYGAAITSAVGLVLAAKAYLMK